MLNVSYTTQNNYCETFYSITIKEIKINHTNKSKLCKDSIYQENTDRDLNYDKHCKTPVSFYRLLKKK